MWHTVGGIGVEVWSVGCGVWGVGCGVWGVVGPLLQKKKKKILSLWN